MQHPVRLLAAISISILESDWLYMLGLCYSVPLANETDSVNMIWRMPGGIVYFIYIYWLVKLWIPLMES